MTGIFKFTRNRVLKRIVKLFFAIIAERNSENRNYNAGLFIENQFFTIQLNYAEARNQFAGFLTRLCSDVEISPTNYLDVSA